MRHLTWLFNCSFCFVRLFVLFVTDVFCVSTDAGYSTRNQWSVAAIVGCRCPQCSPSLSRDSSRVEVRWGWRNGPKLPYVSWKKVKKTTFSSDDLLESFHAQNVTEIIYFWIRFSTERDHFHESSPWMVSMLNPSPSVDKRNSGIRFRKKI